MKDKREEISELITEIILTDIISTFPNIKEKILQKIHYELESKTVYRHNLIVYEQGDFNKEILKVADIVSSKYSEVLLKYLDSEYKKSLKEFLYSLLQDIDISNIIEDSNWEKIEKDGQIKWKHEENDILIDDSIMKMLDEITKNVNKK